MSNLVFIENDRVVTDSLTVAEVFEKEHKHVLRDIKELGCSDFFRQSNFGQSTYENKQGRAMPKYFITEKGFTLLVMGYTGEKAMEFKEKYIEEFEAMKEELKKPRILSEKEQLVASMKLTLETSEELSNVKTKVDQLETKVNDRITLDHGQQTALQHQIKKRIESIFSDYQEQYSKQQLYSQLHSHLRRAFAAPKYIFVKSKDFEDAISWVKAWRPLI